MIKSIDAKLSITLTSLPFTIHIFLGKSYFLLIYVIYNKFHVLYIHITQSQSFVFYKGKFSKKYVLSHFLINLRYLLCTPPLVPIKYLHLMIGIKSTHSCTAIQLNIANQEIFVLESHREAILVPCYLYFCTTAGALFFCDISTSRIVCT